MKPDDPARLSPLRLKLYQRYLSLLRRSGQDEIADQIDRLLFAPIARWEDR